MSPTQMALLVTVFSVALLMLAIWWNGQRPHTLVQIEGGKASIERGALPPGLVVALSELAQLNPSAEFTIEFRGAGKGARWRCVGPDERLDQRVSNLAAPFRTAIRRP